ncbi:MAG: InlB B-repeat-containing protein [Bacilli bacterium]
MLDKKITTVLGVSCIFSLLLAIIGASTAFFTSNIIGNNNASSMLVTAGSLSIDYSDGEEINIKNALPGDSDSKVFRVTNNGTAAVHYNIRWDNVRNNFNTKSDVVYSIKNTNGRIITNEIIAPEFNEYVPLATDIVINPNEIHEYMFKITFKETFSNQNDNQGKVFSGRLQINEFNPKEGDSLIIERPTMNGLELDANLRDTRSSVTAYAITYDDNLKTMNNSNNSYRVNRLNDTKNSYVNNRKFSLPTTWIPINKTSLFHLRVKLNDYDAMLWVKNEAGVIKYLELTPCSVLVIDPAGGTWNRLTGSQRYNLKYKMEMNISDPTKEGHTFIKWNVTGSKISKIENKMLKMGHKDTNLTAEYIKNIYKLSINPDGGKYADNSNIQIFDMEYKTNKEILVPVKEGYTFTGWILEGTNSSLSGNIFTIGNASASLVASWKANNYPYIVYHNKQNINKIDFTLVSADTYNGESPYGSTVTPEVKNYIGFISPTVKSLTIKINNNTISYNYIRNKYNLLIDPSGGTYENQTTNKNYELLYEEEKILSIPSMTGYNFNSWQITGSSTITDNVYKQGVGNTSIKAMFSPQTFILTFNANGGEVNPTSKVISYNDVYGKLPDPQRINYAFDGWYTQAIGGTEVNGSTKVTSLDNITVYAHWIPLGIPMKEAILRDNPVINYVRDDLMFENVETRDLGLWKESREGRTNNNKPVYFYRGSVQNNYVSFAGLTWRVVRINEDDTIRIILDDVYINSPFNKVINTKESLLYKNGNTNSDIKNIVDAWYIDNVLYKRNVKVSDSVYCNDMSGKDSAYGTIERLLVNKSPTFKCPRVEDEYSVVNGKLSYPIGLLTADEVVYAGGKSMTLNNSFYLHNSKISSYWTMSPTMFVSSYAYAFVDSTSSLGLVDNSIADSYAVRPVLSIIKDLRVTGTGTKEDPYIV